jgi:hypothetical protein
LGLSAARYLVADCPEKDECLEINSEIGYTDIERVFCTNRLRASVFLEQTLRKPAG